MCGRASFQTNKLISFNGRRLIEENYTLIDYEINEGSILTLVRPRYQRQMGILIQIITGNRFQLQVDADDTVKDVKGMIQLHGACGRPPREQQLLLRGRPIHDDDTLRELGVKNNSVLYLVFRLRGGESTSYPWYIFQHMFTKEYEREWKREVTQVRYYSCDHSLETIFRGILRSLLPCSYRSAIFALFSFFFYMVLFLLWCVVDRIKDALHDKQKE